MRRGSPFYTDEPTLAAWTRSLNDDLSRHFPAPLDAVPHPALRLQPDQFTGRGVFLADGAVVHRDVPLALYFGEVLFGPASGEYVFELRRFRRQAQSYDLAIDAGSYCRRANPWPGNVALFNHSCLDRTVELRYLPDLAIPCVAAFPLPTLRGGQELRYNYDGGPRSGSYTVDAHGRAQLLAAGVASAQCACRHPAPRPLHRWMRVFR
jgi:hypothetical protein